MNNFWLGQQTDIFFGRGQISMIPRQMKQFGPRVLVVHGQDSLQRNGYGDKIFEQLKKAGAQVTDLGGVEANPDIGHVQTGADLCRKNNIQWVFACGGGSVIDTAKAIAAARYFPRDPWEIFEKRRSVKKALPVGVFLTTAATGSESGPGMVLCRRDTGEKRSFGSMKVIPSFAIMDPVVTYSLPPEQTAAGIADTMSHVFEQYFSTTDETYLQDRIAESIVRTLLVYAPDVLRRPDNYDARAAVMLASTAALNGLSGAGKQHDWAVHRMEHPVSGRFDTPHGAGLAVLTPHWMTHVLDDRNADKFALLGRNVWDIRVHSDTECADMTVSRVSEFLSDLNLPRRLGAFGVSPDDIQTLVEAAMDGDAEIGRYQSLDGQAVETIYRRAL